MDTDGRNQEQTATAMMADYLRHAKAKSTRECYRRDWEHFSAWCAVQGHDPLPASPETVALYLTEMAGAYRPITLTRRVSSISVAHQSAGHPSPSRDILVRSVLSGIRRTHGVRPERKTPIRSTHLRKVAEMMTKSPRDLRDLAILLLGYVGALRRSEIVSLDMEDLQFVDEGLRLRLRRSKTDQEGAGLVMGIAWGTPPTCPVRALSRWLQASGITSGPLFRSVSQTGRVGAYRLHDKSVCLIIKRLAPGLGLDPVEVGAHSLRAGFITDQYAAGTAEAIIMDRSRHRSHAVMSIYRREASTFAFNYTAVAGL